MSNPLKLVVVGSGVSCGVPVVGHVGCSASCVCDEAAANPHSRNRRNNVSLMLSLDVPDSTEAGQSEKEEVRILIDTGKTFRDAYIRVLGPRCIRYLDALLITHGHADAMNCVEELCDIHTATLEWAKRESHSMKPCVGLLPLYLNDKALEEVRLVVKKESLKEPTRDLTHVPQELVPSGRAAMKPYLLPSDVPVRIPLSCLPACFPLYSLPVEHGKGYISLGFVFGEGTSFKSQGGVRDDDHSCVVYISDVTEIPDASDRLLRDLTQIDVFFIDLLAEHGSSSPAHTCWDDVWPLIHRYHPRRTYCVGMFCTIEYESSNKMWAAELDEARRLASEAVTNGKGTDEERAWHQHFLDGVESIELAYDNMELSLPS